MITIATPPINVACTTTRSALSAKNSMNTKMMRAEQQHDPERHGDHALAAVDPVDARLLAVGSLVEPLRVRRLLGGGLGSAVLRMRNVTTPHGLALSPSVPASICGHSWWITVRA